MKKVAIVTGGTSGIGLATARALTAGGYIVYTFSRRGGQARDLSVDVTDEAAVASAVGQVVAAEGRLDLVVNCAGFGISGAVEFTETADAMRLFDVNFFGMVRVNRAALPHLRATGGRIINVSSVAAPVVPGQVLGRAVLCIDGAEAASAENEYVTVSCGTAGVESIVVVGDGFHLTTVNVGESFSASVQVVAQPGWELLSAASLTLSPGGISVYTV